MTRRRLRSAVSVCLYRDSETEAGVERLPLGCTETLADARRLVALAVEAASADDPRWVHWSATLDEGEISERELSPGRWVPETPFRPAGQRHLVSPAGEEVEPLG